MAYGCSSPKKKSSSPNFIFISLSTFHTFMTYSPKSQFAIMCEIRQSLKCPLFGYNMKNAKTAKLNTHSGKALNDELVRTWKEGDSSIIAFV
jgi:hypothetical protein